MKRVLCVLCLFTGLMSPIWAQQKPDGGGGALEAAKIGFISRRLNLSPEEAQKFWPIYNKYAEEVRSAYLVYRQTRNEIQLDESLLNIRKKYSVEFLPAISPGKINDFFRAEKDFAAFVQKEMQRRQLQRQHFAP